MMFSASTVRVAATAPTRLLLATRPRCCSSTAAIIIIANNKQSCRCSMTANNKATTRFFLLPRQQRTKATTTTVAAAAEASAASSSTTKTTDSSGGGGVPVITSLLAAAAGVLTVSGAAAIVETTSPVPKFDVKNTRFDETQFIGRFSKMLLQCDPRLLLYTNQQIMDAQTILQEHELKSNKSASAKASNDDDRTLWEAKRLCDSALNDQGEILPRPFRMSGYVPYNGPVCVAMVASQSTSALLFWSWVNQSQNALVNYYNRNSSSPMTNETLMKSYTAAVGSALLVAFGLATFIQKRYTADQAKLLLRYVAFPSAVVASSLNCYIVRSPEIDTGIMLQNENGVDVFPGTTSQIAAKEGVHATTLSRALLQAPVYFVPPVLMAIIPFIKRYLTKQPHMTVPVTTYLLLVSFGCGLPATVAIFPQQSTIDANQVEEKFQHLRDPTTQQPYKVFYYNKGL